MTTLTTLNNKSIVFIGGGNMATALIDGLLVAKTTHALDFHVGVVETLEEKRPFFAEKGVEMVVSANAKTLLDKADVVVLAVKPQVLAEVCESLLPFPNALIISVAAGISVSSLEQMTKSSRLVRTMPNLPATVGFGATGLYADTAVGADDKATAEAIMGASGMTAWVDTEDKLHAVTAVAGSAPAYFFYVLEAMVAKAVEMGLDEKSALALATQTMQGAGVMAKAGDPADLRAKVTSKGGTTHAAITHLQDNHVGEHIAGAMQACYQRSLELGK